VCNRGAYKNSANKPKTIGEDTVNDDTKREIQLRRVSKANGKDLVGSMHFMADYHKLCELHGRVLLSPTEDEGLYVIREGSDLGDKENTDYQKHVLRLFNDITGLNAKK